MMNWMKFNRALIVLLLTGSVVSADERENAGLDLFKSHVRTDLIHHCLECHGGRSVKGDFNLATREQLMDSGFVEDTAADSVLMDLITHAEEPRMPFKKPKLAADKIARIGRWIDLGAPYDKPLTERAVDTSAPMQVTNDDRGFWSFRPLANVSPPQVNSAKAKAWMKTPVDAFVAAKLLDAGISANPPAEKRTLIRRAYFDLIGLPPSPDDVDRFVNDDDPRAFEKLVDDLLSSEHFGERQARHWMDVARFAESYGYEQDTNRNHAYHYRDFLIRAFNADMPFDQFVRWQLAGDELVPNSAMAKMATGFLGAGVFPTQLTEAEFESARYDELDDMTTTTGVAFLGLSIGCARCHDHKFDPIPTRDYYRIASTFTRTIRTEMELELDPELNKKVRAEFATTSKKLTDDLAAYENGPLQAKFDRWTKTASFPAEKLSPWSVLVPTIVTSTKGQHEVLPDQSVLAVGDAPNKNTVKIESQLTAPPKTAADPLIHAIRLEALTHDSFPGRGPGRAPNGNFALGNFTVKFRPQGGKAMHVPLERAAATHQQDGGSLSVAASIDDDKISGWAVDRGGIGKDQAAVFFLKEPLKIATGTLYVTLAFQHPNTKHEMGRIRLSTSHLTNPPVEVGGGGIDAATRNAIAAVRTGNFNKEQRQLAFHWFRHQDSDWQTKNSALSKHKSNGPRLAKTRVQFNSENVPKIKHNADGRGYPHFYEKTHFLVRGDVNQKQEVATPGFLQVLNESKPSEKAWQVNRPETATTSFHRARFAQWITDPNNVSGQLLARVIVNRLWQWHFGRGIVATPNDFGFQGERPTHPELLDWLARDLIANNWKLKRLHKLIMLSAAWQQSSEFQSAHAKIDPDNKLLWRRTPRRLEAEAIRDSMLAVSGSLDPKLFGPGTLNESMNRRSIYFFIKRSKLIPMMMLFDWPEHLVSIGQRASTTIAPQALMFMNNPQARRYAEAFAASSAKSGDIREVITSAYRHAFGRAPTSRESQLAINFLDHQQNLHANNNVPTPDSAALTDFCQTLFSMNEFIYID